MAPPEPAQPLHESMPRQALLLAAWALAWAVLEHLLRARGLDDRALAAAQLLILALLAAAGALAPGTWLLGLLTSVRFAVTQGLFLAAALLLDAANPHGPGAVLAALQGPAGVRGSLWFSALLALLAVSALAVTWKRRPFDLARLGFLLVHCAPALALLGLLWGRLGGVRAAVGLRPGAAAAAVTEGARRIPLPGFQLRLERFDRPASAAGPLIYARLAVPLDPGQPVALAPVAGAGAELAPGGCRVDLLQAIAAAVPTGQVADNPFAPPSPALRVVLGLGLPEPLVGHLFAQGQDRQDEPGGRFAVVFREAWDDGLADSLRPAPPAQEKLVLEGPRGSAEHPLRPLETWRLPGFQLRVVRLYPDFAVRRGANGGPEAYSRSDQPREPWAQLELTGADGSVRTLLLSAREPQISDRLNAPNLPAGTTLRYLRLGGEAQRRFVVFTAADRAVRLLEDGRVARTEALELGRPFIVEKGLSVTPDALLTHAEPVYAAAPDAGAGRPVVRVRVSSPGTPAEERWLEAAEPGAATRPAAFLGGRVVLCYREPVPAAAACRSELALVDPQGRILAQGPVDQGRTLAYRGWRFAQGPGDPYDPAACMILVAHQPGLGLVWAACACLLLGAPWMFYLKPMLKRRQAARPAAP